MLESSEHIGMKFSIDVHLKDNLFDKEINEEFCKDVFLKYFNAKKYRYGNHILKEPDIYIDDLPIEITLVSDKKKTNNFVQKLKNRYQNNVSIEDIESEILSMMEERIKDKSNKSYCNKSPSLCLIVPIPIISWYCYYLDPTPIDIIELLYSTPRSRYFKRFMKNYIENDIFSDIFILMPGIYADWLLINIRTNKAERYLCSTNDFRYSYYLLVE